MGSSLGSIGKALGPIAQIASFIPGPIGAIGQTVSGISGVLGGAGAAGDAQRQVSQGQKGMGQMTAQQLQILMSQLPRLGQLGGANSELLGPLMQNAQQGMTDARQYDPHAETVNATRAYDEAARTSLNRDIGQGTAGLSLRGFGRNNSEVGGQIGNVLGSRAAERASFVGGLGASETQRKQQMTGNAFSRGLQGFGATDPSNLALGLSSGLGNPAQGYAQQAQFGQQNLNNYDPSGMIGLAAQGLQGLTKRKPQPKPAQIGSGWGGSLGRGSYMNGK